MDRLQSAAAAVNDIAIVTVKPALDDDLFAIISTVSVGSAITSESDTSLIGNASFLFSFGTRGLRTSWPLWDESKVVLCPAFAESISEGDIRWEKAVGDSVGMDEVVAEVETDKTSVPIPSPIAGVILELLVEDGATVNPGQQLLKITVGEGGGGGGGGAAAAPTPAPPAEAAPAPAAPEPPKAVSIGKIDFIGFSDLSE